MNSEPLLSSVASGKAAAAITATTGMERDGLFSPRTGNYQPPPSLALDLTGARAGAEPTKAISSSSSSNSVVPLVYVRQVAAEPSLDSGGGPGSDGIAGGSNSVVAVLSSPRSSPQRNHHFLARTPPAAGAGWSPFVRQALFSRLIDAALEEEEAAPPSAADESPDAEPSQRSNGGAQQEAAHGSASAYEEIFPFLRVLPASVSNKECPVVVTVVDPVATTPCDNNAALSFHFRPNSYFPVSVGGTEKLVKAPPELGLEQTPESANGRFGSATLLKTDSWTGGGNPPPPLEQPLTWPATSQEVASRSGGGHDEVTNGRALKGPPPAEESLIADPARYGAWLAQRICRRCEAFQPTTRADENESTQQVLFPATQAILKQRVVARLQLLNANGGLSALKNEKATVKNLLRAYDNTWNETYRQLPTKEEKEPMRELYTYYRRLKSQISRYEGTSPRGSQLSKQRTAAATTATEKKNRQRTERSHEVARHTSTQTRSTQQWMFTTPGAETAGSGIDESSASAEAGGRQCDLSCSAAKPTVAEQTWTATSGANPPAPRSNDDETDDSNELLAPYRNLTEEELKAEIQALLTRKEGLTKVMRSFQLQFEKDHGRKIKFHSDIVPLEQEYNQYKRIRAQLALLDEAMNERRARRADAAARGGGNSPSGSSGSSSGGSSSK